MIIRQMSILDYEQLLKLWNKALRDNKGMIESENCINRFLKQNPCLNLVCQIENKIVGAILCGCDGRTGYIYDVVVDREAKLKGINIELVNQVLRRLKIIGITSCHIIECSSNLGDIEFWDADGWKKAEGKILFYKSIE